MDLLKKFVKDEAGLETVEWAVLAAIIVGATVTAIGLIGTGVSTRFQGLQGAVGQ